jgi:hypothetical protein
MKDNNKKNLITIPYHVIKNEKELDVQAKPHYNSIKEK